MALNLHPSQKTSTDYYGNPDVERAPPIDALTLNSLIAKGDGAKFRLRVKTVVGGLPKKALINQMKAAIKELESREIGAVTFTLNVEEV